MRINNEKKINQKRVDEAIKSLLIIYKILKRYSNDISNTKSIGHFIGDLQANDEYYLKAAMSGWSVFRHALDHSCIHLDEELFENKEECKKTYDEIYHHFDLLDTFFSDLFDDFRVIAYL